MDLTKEQKQIETALEFVETWNKKLETWIKDPYTRGEIIKEFYTDSTHLMMMMNMIYIEGEEENEDEHNSGV